ncbi:diaminopimelate decarboxylase [Agrobacterium vitis]|uniref:type III PLP-dependent enzyme n=1 Tax=Agrobacterium vitis TaxID=373 RepID=UPI001F17A823|nr:type III PLP-dependent enzyme [Agrobacterium vitis]MCF1470143.1 diaminopimelate decarboxylase [Agrobacterium vitis]
MTLPDDILTRVADRVGTPAFVYDAVELRHGVARLKFVLPDVDFFYSLKANPNVSVVRTLTSQGIGAEVCSLFEIEACLAAGVAPERIIFVGPAKSQQEIEFAISLGFKAIVAESLPELKLIDTVAARKGVCQRVALRINPSFHTPGARLSMSGKATQFGIDETEIEAAIALIAEADSLRLSGLHVYMGTRILDYQVIVENSRDILALARRVTEISGEILDFVDIGGGFGVAHGDHETDLDLERLGEVLTPVLRAAKQDAPQTSIAIELGRYMVARAGSFLARVRYTKISKGKRFAILDGGSNCHSAAGQAASFRRNFPISLVGAKMGGEEPWSLSGPLCTPTDVIAHDLQIQNLEARDLIRVDRSGAYGPTASPVNFLSFGMPIEVMVDGTEMVVIRERLDLAGYLGPQVPRPLERDEDRHQLEEIA